MEHQIVYWRPSSSKISSQSSMMPLINHFLYFGVNEWEFLSADDEVLASEMHNWVVSLSFVNLKTIVYEGQK